MKLYSYWRSTTTYRVRAALNLKGVAYDMEPVDLTAGVQRSGDYRAVNPAQGVPALDLGDGVILTQSMAILDYLEVRYPEPALLPQDPLMRAKVQAAAHVVALDIHPVNNLRVIGQLKSRFEADTDQVQDWMQYWMNEGFTALEALLPNRDGFAFDDTPGLADLCITSQVYNARRWGVDLTQFPKIARIEMACLAVPAIADAHPDQQPDAKVH